MTKGQDLTRRSVVWDNHTCLPLRQDERFMEGLYRHLRSGATVVSVNVSMSARHWDDVTALLGFFRSWLTERPEHFVLVRDAKDVVAAKSSGRLGVCFDVEGMDPVVDCPDRVQSLYELGVRWMLIAYNRANGAGGGCLEEDRGLTVRGREIIAHMERVGMVLCLSHTGERTARDALECCVNPPIFSHSNPAGDHAHPRNISDALIKACAARGGVIGISGFGAFLGARRSDLIERFVAQTLYVVGLVGPSAVGLGLDYVFDTKAMEQNIRANPERYPTDLSASIPMVPPEALHQIADGLLRKGLSGDDVAGIMGGNWLRVASRVWGGPQVP